MEYQLFLSNVKERLIEELPADVHVEDSGQRRITAKCVRGFYSGNVKRGSRLLSIWKITMNGISEAWK